jgi:anaerobic magnesium-protoporphyrin IX monomethyl ester cyclase
MTPYFPLGIAYVAAAAREAGYSVAIFDAMFAAGDEDFVAALAQEQPRVVGFGVLATVRRTALRLAVLAKRGGAMVVAGGADPTARPEVYLSYKIDGIHPLDVVVVGEAEQTIVELLPLLLRRESRPDVHGVAYRNADGAVVITPRRPLIEDVDRIPLPARDLVDLEPYRRAWRDRHGAFSISLMATRGCPYGCAWCQKTVFGRSFRPRAPELVADEMRLIKDRYRPDQLRIVDDVLGIDREWMHRWHDAVLEKDAVIPFECLSRVDLIDKELAQLLKEMGCRRIAFGTESGSQRVLDAMTKGTKVEQIYRTAEICREQDIETYFYMMVGYPGEEWDDLQLSAKLLRDARPDAFSTTIAYPLPGTAFYEQVRDGLPKDDQAVGDWDYTAENRLLFATGAYTTFFYRRVIRWFHSEWRDARVRAGEPMGLLGRFKSAFGLWRDRLLVNLLARVPGVAKRAKHRTASPRR